MRFMEGSRTVVVVIGRIHLCPCGMGPLSVLPRCLARDQAPPGEAVQGHPGFDLLLPGLMKSRVGFGGGFRHRRADSVSQG